MQPTTTASQDWPDDHDNLLSPAHGRIPAFDQFDELANGQTVQRTNRIPRMPARARKPGLSRRLYIRALQFVLLLRIDWLQQRADGIERQLKQTAQDAHQLSQPFRYSPLIEARRRTLRRELAEVSRDFLQIRQRMDNLTAELQ